MHAQQPTYTPTATALSANTPRPPIATSISAPSQYKRSTYNRPPSSLATRHDNSSSIDRRASLAYGHAPLATSETIDGPADNEKKSPLDSVPALFTPSALDSVHHHRPHTEDVDDLNRTLQSITRDTCVELESEERLLGVEVPNVAAGWSGNRRQQVSEHMLMLANAIDKLLVEPEPLPPSSMPASSSSSSSSSHPSFVRLAHPLANLRSEFLNSREILSAVIHAHRNESIMAMAPSLLAVSKTYQNRLLELQGMDEIRLEIEPQEKFKEKYQKIKQAESAEHEPAQQQVKPKEEVDKKSSRPSSHINRRSKNRLSSTSSSLLAHHRRAPSNLVPPSSAVNASPQPVTPSSPPTAPIPATNVILPITQPTSQMAAKFRRLENQGSLDMYLPWNLIKREMHLFHPKIAELTRLYWRTCFMQDDGTIYDGIHQRRSSIGANSVGDAPYLEGGLLVGLPRKTYMQMYTLIHYVLKPSYLPSYAQQVVAADWLTDVSMVDQPKEANRVLMTLAQFHIGLFNLVDVWTEGVTLEEYVLFLKKLFEFITEEIPAVATNDASRQSLAHLQEEDESKTADADAMPPLTNSVYHRRLKQLNIVNINNLRKLGLKASSFRELTIDMLNEIESKSRLVGSEKAAYDARMREVMREKMMSSSDSTSSLLTALKRLDHGETEREFRPRTFSVHRRATILQTSQQATNATAKDPTTDGEGNHPSGVTNRRMSSSALSSKSLLAKQQQQQPLTPIMNQLNGLHSPTAPRPEVSPFPSRAKLAQRRSTVNEVKLTTIADANGDTSDGATANATTTNRAVLKPSKAQVSIESGEMPSAPVTLVFETEEDLADALSLPVSSPSNTSSASSTPTPLSTPRPSVIGRLSWKLPVDEVNTEELLKKEFEEMKLQHDEWKLNAQARREKDRIETEEKVRRLHALAEDEENGQSDDDDDDNGQSKKARLKRANSRSKSGSKTARPSSSSNGEEKQSSTSHSQPGSQTATPNRPPNRRIGSGSRAHASRTTYRGHPVPSFDQQRQRFAMESAAYLARLDRLQRESFYQQQANGSQTSFAVSLEPTENEKQVAEIIRNELIHGLDPITRPAAMATNGGTPISPIPHDLMSPSHLHAHSLMMPAPGDVFTPPAFYSPDWRCCTLESSGTNIPLDAIG